MSHRTKIPPTHRRLRRLGVGTFASFAALFLLSTSAAAVSFQIDFVESTYATQTATPSPTCLRSIRRAP